MTSEDKNFASMYACIGRLAGLAGTVRYDLEDELRDEITQIMEQLQNAVAELDSSDVLTSV